MFAAGIAISGEPISSNQRLRSVLWFAALLGWGVVVQAILVVAEIDPQGRSRGQAPRDGRVCSRRWSLEPPSWHS